MWLVVCWGELHYLWLVGDICLVTMMFRSTETLIVLTNLLLNFLLDWIKLSPFCLLLILWIRLIWLGFHSSSWRDICPSIVGWQFWYVRLSLLGRTLPSIVLRDTPVSLRLRISTALVECLSDCARQIVLRLKRLFVGPVWLLSWACVVVRPAIPRWRADWIVDVFWLWLPRIWHLFTVFGSVGLDSLRELIDLSLGERCRLFLVQVDVAFLLLCLYLLLLTAVVGDLLRPFHTYHLTFECEVFVSSNSLCSQILLFQLLCLAT